MYPQNHQSSQNVFMNGSHGQQRFGGMQMNPSKTFQSNQHNHTLNHQRQHPQDHNGYSNHQHNMSSSRFSGSTPHFNPSSARNGTPGQLQNGVSRPHNEHWGQQLVLAQQARESTTVHPRARNPKPGVPTAIEQARKDADREDRHRGIRESDQERHSWTELDMGGLGLRALSPGLFAFPFLKKLYLNNNKLARLSPAIGKLRGLTHLDLSLNHIEYLPAELGMLVNLRELLIVDNNLETLPLELGFLFQLNMLAIEGNPLHEDLRTMVEEDGTRALISFLQESAVPEPPEERDWFIVDESRMNATTAPSDKVTVLTYNTLCDKAATQALYGYTPPSALAWDNRKQMILSECRMRDADILCLQEVEQDAYNEFFRPDFAHNGYRGVFWPRSRARTMTDKEGRQVDGCATFFKSNKYILLDKQVIEFANIAINRPDMKTESAIFNRVMPRDHIAVVTFLENRYTGSRLIVVNLHLLWDQLYRDVKVVQVAIMMEQITRLADGYAKMPACKDKKLFRYSDSDALPGSVETPPEPNMEPAPSQEYSNGTQIPLMVCGDFNALTDSGVYELLSTGALPRDHPDLMEYRYGNFTRDGMAHPFQLKSAYTKKEMPFTNYTPTFMGMIDYIWYSNNSLTTTALLGPVDPNYVQRMPGFPNVHYPSDHIALMAEFAVKQRKQERMI